MHGSLRLLLVTEAPRSTIFLAIYVIKGFDNIAFNAYYVLFRFAEIHS